MSEDDYELVSGYADFQRSSLSIGVGNVIGSKFTKLQQIMRAQTLSPKEKFLQAVQFICYTDNIGFAADVYETIADRHHYPQYLNPKACVYAVAYLLSPTFTVNTASLENTEELESFGIQVLDAYRYAVLLSSLLRNK